MSDPIWQPIETAPKDGTLILGRDGDEYAVCYFWDNYWTLQVTGAFASDGEWWPKEWTPIPSAEKYERGLRDFDAYLSYRIGALKQAHCDEPIRMDSSEIAIRLMEAEHIQKTLRGAIKSVGENSADQLPEEKNT